MKKNLISLIAFLLCLAVTGGCCAASYTLPEKMFNQLTIGSGLKGIFTISAEGEKFQTPFLDSINQSEFSLRGISSGQDFHYSVFQSDEQEQQSAVSELYRKDGVYYFRSDMVPGKVLSLPVLIQYLETFFPAKGENGSASGFASKIMTLSEEEQKNKWEPVLKRYQNELEMWLADFTVQGETIRMENGSSALDFSYEIPMNMVNEQIVKLFGEIASDPEASALLDSVMTKEEKEVYANSNLLYFYREALSSIDQERAVCIKKRVSAMGEVLRFRLELPLDERTAGYHSLDIETVDGLTVYTLRKNGQLIQIGLPETEKLKQTSYEQSAWFAFIDSGSEKHAIDNMAVRIDIHKTNETYNDDEERSHEINHYAVTVTKDTTYLPDDAETDILPEFDQIIIDFDMHYYSKYAQNSATTLEITADIRQSNSEMKVEGKLKTAPPWLFLPFEVDDPVQTGTNADEILVPYFAEWISNAESMIRHLSAADAEQASENEVPVQADESDDAQEETETDDGQESESEAVPLDTDEQE